MAHFAELDANNYVINRIVVANADLLDENGQESETVGIAFLESVFGPGRIWKQCSYNGNFRGRYPDRDGYVYDPILDEFILPAVPGPQVP